MKKKLISLLCAFAALTAIMIFSCLEAGAQTITPDVKLNYTSYEYTGSPLGPGLSVYDDNGNVLTKNKDYVVKYNGERVQPGTYSVTVSFIGAYEGSQEVTKEFSITENKVNIKLNNTSYEHTGKPLGPGLTVTDSKGKVLTRNVDYTLKYNGERIKPGKYSVTVTMIGSYAGTHTEYYNITENKVNIKLNNTSYEHTGKPLGPGLTVTDSKGKVLTRNVDYTLKYNGERIKPGKYSVTVTMIGSYAGTHTEYYNITENKVNIKLNNTSYEHTGKPLGPGLTVTDSKGKVLTRNVDYTLKYNGERIKPGKYSVTVTMIGSYAGTHTEYYNITENKVNIKLNNTSYEHTGKPLGPGLTVTDGKGKVLTRDVDYTLKYNGERIKPGKYSVTVTMIGSYAGTHTEYYNITENKVNIKLNNTSYEFTGKPLGPGLTVTDSKGKVLTRDIDYTLKYNGERIEPGTYSVTVTLMGNYVGSATANYKITENNVTVKLNNTIYECTGKPLGPGLTVMNSKGTVLTRNVDYTLKYNGERIKPGIYSVTVTLKGNYRGSVTEEYQIVETYKSIPLNSKAISCSNSRKNCTRYIYGTSSMGYSLDAFIIDGNGKNNKVIFIDFAVHGFEDEYARDGQVLVQLGNELVEYYAYHPELLGDYRMVIVPCANPDGTIHGKNNYRAEKSGAFGRCTYTGVDMNRDFKAGGFKAVESRALRDLMNKYPMKIYLNFHGWLDGVYGNPELVKIFRANAGLTEDHSNAYGASKGYIEGYVNNTFRAKSAMVELRNTKSVNTSKVISAINTSIAKN